MRRPVIAALLVVVAAVHARLATAQVFVGSNGFYDVAVDEGGAYTVATSANHPGPASADVLAGGLLRETGTSWNTLRSYDSNREWVLAAFPGGLPAASTGYTAARIGDVAWPSISPIADAAGIPKGVRTEWSLRDGADAFDVVQEVEAVGSSADDARVRVSLCVRNRAAHRARVALRFLWDPQIGGRGLGYLGMRPPDPPGEPFLDSEADLWFPADGSWSTCDVDAPSSVDPDYCIAGTIAGASDQLPRVLRFARAADIGATCFDYATAGRPAGSTDSAVAYFWGAPWPIELGSGKTYCATDYLFAYDPPAAPFCRVDAVLLGGISCLSLPIRLDASPSSASRCDGELEYRFIGPTGVATTWSTESLHDADLSGEWSVDVRCSLQPSCVSTARAVASVFVPPRIVWLEATDMSTCERGIRVDWNAFFPGDSRTGTFELHRSSVSCGDALDSGVLASGSVETSFVDSWTIDGGVYWYALVLEGGDGSGPCLPRGSHGGAVTARCFGPVVDLRESRPQTGPCHSLRVRHDGDRVDLDWDAARLLRPGEHFHVLEASTDPRTNFLRINREGDLRRGFGFEDSTSLLRFYDVRIADACEHESPDDEPPGSLVVGGPCP